jgi:hypothetical protein
MRASSPMGPAQRSLLTERSPTGFTISYKGTTAQLRTDKESADDEQPLFDHRRPGPPSGAAPEPAHRRVA